MAYAITCEVELCSAIWWHMRGQELSGTMAGCAGTMADAMAGAIEGVQEIWLVMEGC